MNTNKIANLLHTEQPTLHVVLAASMQHLQRNFAEKTIMAYENNELVQTGMVCIDPEYLLHAWRFTPGASYCNCTLLLVHWGPPTSMCLNVCWGHPGPARWSILHMPQPRQCSWPWGGCSCFRAQCASPRHAGRCLAGCALYCPPAWHGSHMCVLPKQNHTAMLQQYLHFHWM